MIPSDMSQNFFFFYGIIPFALKEHKRPTAYVQVHTANTKQVSAVFSIGSATGTAGGYLTVAKADPATNDD